MCSCGCNTCDIKPLSINESILKANLLSEGLRYHIKHQKPISENVYRYGSDKYLALYREVRHLYSRNLIKLGELDTELITESDLGEYGLYEALEVGDTVITEVKGKKYKNQVVDIIGEQLVLKNGRVCYESDVTPKEQRSIKVPLDLILTEEMVNELEHKGKKVQLNKPKRGGSKKFYVYVRDPKSKRIKKVSFGDTSGLKAKINDPKARKAFAERHNCKNKKDKTKAGYWSCRLPRYAKLLGLKGTYSGYW